MEKFSAPSQLFHWVVAGLVFFQIPLAYYMISLPVSPDKLATYALHKSMGMTIFTLTACRLAWRWIKPPPPLPAAMPRLEQRLAHLNHGVLYFITFAMPITGWLSSSAANFPVSVFRLFTLPNLVQPDPLLHERLELVHRGLAYTLFTMLGMHIVAALHHHFARRDNVLASMLPFTRAK